MRKFFMGFGVVALFMGITWGMFFHGWLALIPVGAVIGWLAANWEDD